MSLLAELVTFYLTRFYKDLAPTEPTLASAKSLTFRRSATQTSN
jgi:hypothetical protein